MSSPSATSFRRTSQALAGDRKTVLFVATFGGFLVTFMSSAVNVALPQIGEEFAVSAVMLSWLSLSMILVSGAIILPVGRLADIYGRVRFFTLSMIIFAISCLASAAAPSAGVLLGLRMLSGVSLAVGSATASALVILAYPVETRGRALGLNIGGIYLGLMVGPVLGGFIVHYLGWRGLFLVAGAAALVNVAIPVWKLRHIEWREPRPGRFDLLGSFLYAAGLTALLLGFSSLPRTAGVLLLIAGVAGVAAFLWWETRAADPLLSVDLLRRNRVFAYSNAAVIINYAATSAMVFLMSLYLQKNRGLDPQTAGLLLVAGAFVQTAFSPVAGRLSDRLEARYVATAGMVFCFLGLLLLVFLGETTPYWYIITALCLLGLGIAFFASPITHTIMGSVDKTKVGMASATLAAARQAGMNMSMGIATCVIAVVVGQTVIKPSVYPELLTSIRLAFLIFTVLSALGVMAALVGPRRESGRGRRED
jgi:MFS family permease